MFGYIFLSQISSVPLNSTSFIIGFGEVTGGEFLYIQYVVSCINSVKCCLLGQQIRVATQPGTVILLSNIIVAITVIPTLLTVGLSYFTVHVYRTQLQCSLHTTAQGQLPLKAERAEHARHAEEDECDYAADHTAAKRSTSRRGCRSVSIFRSTSMTPSENPVAMQCPRFLSLAHLVHRYHHLRPRLRRCRRCKHDCQSRRTTRQSRRTTRQRSNTLANTWWTIIVAHTRRSVFAHTLASMELNLCCRSWPMHRCKSRRTTTYTTRTPD